MFLDIGSLMRMMDVGTEGVDSGGKDPGASVNGERDGVIERGSG